MNPEAFLLELTQLATKHNIIIEGCGCCGSPWLRATDLAKPPLPSFRWNDEVNAYEINPDV